MFSSTQINVHGMDGYGFETVYLARQPIVDRHENLEAYELLFRTSMGGFDASYEATEATAAVVSSAFYGMGVEAVLGSVKAFINVDEHFLMSEAVESLPSNRVVLEILETVIETAEVVARVRQLRQMGYSFALDDFVGDIKNYPHLLDEITYLKIDITGLSEAKMAAILASLKRPKLILLAEKVESREQYASCLALGFHLFQGYFFAMPQVLRSKQAGSPQQADLLNLLRMTLNDSDPREIANVMKRLPTVTLGVLRAINAGSSGLRKKVSSLTEALILIGQARLGRIVQVMAYARPGTRHGANPLMQMAAARGRLIEDLVARHPHATLAEHDCAYLAGMLSLIEPIIAGSLEEVCQQLGLGPELEAALLSRSGVLGRLIALCEAVDAGNDAQVVTFLAELQGMSGTEFMRMQVSAGTWAQSTAE